MKKNMVCLVAGVIAIFSLLFLPLLSVQGLITFSFFDMPPNRGIFDQFCTIVMVAALIAGICAMYGALKEKKKITFSASAVAACSMLLSLFTMPDNWSGFSYGIGFWISFVAFAFSAFAARGRRKKKDEE